MWWWTIRAGFILRSFPRWGYTLQTGFAGVISANAAFFTNAHNHKDENISTVVSSVAYTAKDQFILPISADIWTKDNKFDIVTDWRYLKYPSETFGLGGHTQQDDGYYLDYYYLKLHQAIYKRVTANFYAGIGYDFDYLWDIEEVTPPPGQETDFEKYGYAPTEKASGLSFSLKYDSRRNPLNPQKGIYANILFQPKFVFMGSDANWQSLLLEFRTYIPFPSCLLYTSPSPRD